MKNMHYFIILILVLFTIDCATTRKTKSLTQLNGNWTPIKQEIGGKDLPTNYFQTQKLIIQDTTYTFIAESVDKGTLTYKNGQMDIYGKEGVNRGKHFTALYKLDNNRLTIVYNLKGDYYPTEFETKSNPTLFLSVFKKE